VFFIRAPFFRTSAGQYLPRRRNGVLAGESDDPWPCRFLITCPAFCEISPKNVIITGIWEKPAGSISFNGILVSE